MLRDRTSTRNMAGVMTSITEFEYSLLENITNNFDETPFEKTIQNQDLTIYQGRKIGSGAFGTVYFGQLPSGKKVAVKRLVADNVTVLLGNELRISVLYKHKNLVQFLGFTINTPHLYLVHEFLPNGSLLDRLHKDSTESILPWITRMKIATDVAEGINFLHNSKAAPVVHRDIKSANILLDENLSAKIGDFTLVEFIPVSEKYRGIITELVFGTSSYMPPEAFRGDVSVKTDVYSFGVVLLELLTSLPPFDEEREGNDLVTYVENEVEDSIETFLDCRVKDWNVPLAQKVFELSEDCRRGKKNRPFINEVLQRLKTLFDSIFVI